MSDRKIHLIDGCTIVVLGGLCLVISVYFFFPNVESSVGEVRVGAAYNEVIYQQQILSGVIEVNKNDPDQNDPWGEPYITETLPDGTIRVMSKGPNKTTPESGFDDDDIHSGMHKNPLEKVYRAKQLQMFMTLVIAVVSWIGLSFLWWKFGKEV